MTTVAALYVATGGAYFGLPDVDPWDEKRDARLYAGPWPVVAHPPCARWCRLAGLVESLGGAARGEDGGTFAAALSAVRTYGGVLEHPEGSSAFAAFGLPIPPRSGGWQGGFCGGWSCCVEQGKYGHLARKATWLYAHGTALPRLLWGSSADVATHVVTTSRRVGQKLPEMRKADRIKTPLAFRDALLAIARSVPAPVSTRNA